MSATSAAIISGCPLWLIYLVIDPKNRHIMHCFRDEKEIQVEAVNRDHLSLDPPGLRLDLAELFV